jgi:hypothetical protein
MYLAANALIMMAAIATRTTLARIAPFRLRRLVTKELVVDCGIVVVAMEELVNSVDVEDVEIDGLVLV